MATAGMAIDLQKGSHLTSLRLQLLQSTSSQLFISVLSFSVYFKQLLALIAIIIAIDINNNTYHYSY